MSGLSKNRWFQGRLVACVLATLTISISGCSSSGSKGGGGGSSGADTAAAEAQVSEYSAPMTSVDLPPLKKTPAPGKKIIFVVNNLPESGYIGDGAVDAGKLLGWDVKKIVYDVASPTGVTAAFAQAVDESPDGVMTNATNTTDYAAAAKALAQKKIPVVT